MPQSSETIVAHTPGPWRAGKPEEHAGTWVIYGADEYPVIVAHVVRQPAAVNARLIAAAPEMYEALKQTATFLGHIGRLLDSATGDAVLGAIAKAEGRTRP